MNLFLTNAGFYSSLLLSMSLVSGCAESSSGQADKTITSAAPSKKEQVLITTENKQSEESPGISDPVDKTGSDDVIATVAGESIHFKQLNTMLNSSPMVGLSIPSLGSPERRQVIITLLDKAISANLLYLEAKQQKMDLDKEYMRDTRRFDDAVLASLYKSRFLIGDISVTKEEIEQFHKTSLEADEELTDDIRNQFEAKLRNSKLNKKKATMRQRLREGVQVKIDDSVLDPFKDSNRTDLDIVATINERPVFWGDVKELMYGADRRTTVAEFYLDSDEERLKRLNVIIDTNIMSHKARDAGLESEREFINRSAEFHKTRMVNIHRNRLVKSWSPDNEELEKYFQEHINTISIPEMRKIQMVVLKTEEEALDIRNKIESGEITMYQAARDYSTDINAKKTLGEMGWVAEDSGFPELDKVTFMLEPETLSEPVKSPAGWHLVKVMDVQDEQRSSLDDPQAYRTALRMFIRHKLNEHVIELRKNSFKVSVDQGKLAKLFDEEEQFIAKLTEKSKADGSITKAREKELKKWMY